MMSIATVKSASSAGNYYTDKDNYYAIGSMGDRWAGKGAEELGLSSGVDQKIFTKVLEGCLPDGSNLSRNQDGANKHRPGYDLTFSAPKSISVMAMLGGDTRLIDAHNRASGYRHYPRGSDGFHADNDGGKKRDGAHRQSGDGSV